METVFNVNLKYDDWDEPETYFKQFNPSEIQRKAYKDAQREYLATCEY